MRSNVRLIGPDGPAGLVVEILDYTLFMYGLSRGDRVLVGSEEPPHYAELRLFQLDDQWRLGIPYFEKRPFWTRLSGLVTASRVEFSVPPDRERDLVDHGPVTKVVVSALRGI